MTSKLKSILLKLETPTSGCVPGRGFYQVEEDALYVPVGEPAIDRHFFSYLESKQVRFDIDLQGRLMLIEVDFARRKWKVDEQLVVPARTEEADIRWLDFRTRMPNPEILTNEQRTILTLRFSSGNPCTWYSLAESVLAQIDQDNHLAALMITDIKDDLAGHQVAAFRKNALIERERLNQSNV